MRMTILYNNPAGGTQSSIDGAGSNQINESAYWRKAIVEHAPDIVFSRQTSTKEIPKHHGKSIEAYVHFPILDDRNVNDQGIDANGATIDNGNLWGGSKDIGTITKFMPLLTEEGGRVNRVGPSRLKVKGTIQDFGFFMEFSRDMLNFDTEEDIFAYLSDSAMEAAIQIYEATLQRDLLSHAGVEFFAGDATANDSVNGNTDIPNPSIVKYLDLMNLSTTLDENRTPRQTKIIKGSRLFNTTPVRDGRLLYIGSELTSTVRTMLDPFGNPAFTPTSKYADATNILDNEEGAIDRFRLIMPPQMQHWAGAGADVGDDGSGGTLNGGFRETDGKYDIYPMLVVGEDSFVTLTFFEDGRSSKFEAITQFAGAQSATSANPYGKLGFMSMQWWYGFLVKRPERIAVIKTLAKM